MTVNFHLTKDEVIKIFGSAQKFIDMAAKANYETSPWKFGSIEVEVDDMRPAYCPYEAHLLPDLPTYIQVNEDITEIPEDGDIVIEANFREENQTLSYDPTDVNNVETPASLMMRYLKSLIGE